MTQETFTKETFWAQLDSLGEQEVRARIVTKKYGSGNSKLELAEEWLRQRERARSDASNSEQIDIARSAKDAAWAAAAEARKANTNAKIAVAIAILSLIATIIVPFFHRA